MPRAAKHKARLFGQCAEFIACLLLMLKGYRILARNMQVKGGEIDIIAARAGLVAFVEVKARPTLEAALTAISPEKQRRISKAARIWLSRNRWAAATTLRGDAIYVAPFRLPRHLIAAYELAL